MELAEWLVRGAGMEPVRIFSTQPDRKKFKIYAGLPIFFTEGLCSAFNKPNDKL